MRILWLLVIASLCIACASLAPSAGSKGQTGIAIGHITAVQGSVVHITGGKKRALTAHDIYTPISKNDRFTLSGKNAKLSVQFHTQSEPSNFTSAKPYAKPGVIAKAPSRKSNPLYTLKTVRGGAPRSGPGTIICPAEQSNIRPRTAYIRWNPIDKPVKLN